MVRNIREKYGFTLYSSSNKNKITSMGVHTACVRFNLVTHGGGYHSGFIYMASAGPQKSTAVSSHTDFGGNLASHASSFHAV